jgi:hypothetical protein
MNVREFEAIKEKITSATKKRDMAEGAKNKIVESWKKEYSITTQEEVETKLEELEKDIEKDKATRDKLFIKLESSADWDSL